MVDNDRAKVKSLRAGELPIHKELLPELLERHGGTQITFSTEIQVSFKGAEIVFIPVGTPPSPNGETDLSYVEAVARELALSL
jgi:UDPglucose 6-dehydrogenase